MLTLVFTVFAAAQGPQTRIDSGLIEGLASGNESAFLGIPFAAPPTGDRRWRPPQSPSKWQGVRPAKSFGLVCPQSDFAGMKSVDELKDIRMSEDCLYLNVWTSNLGKAQKQPVMVWSHGQQPRGTGAIHRSAPSWPRKAWCT